MFNDDIEGPDGNWLDDGVTPPRVTLRHAYGTSYRGRGESDD